MARTSQIVEVGKRRLELSNLVKVLYPDDHLLKAEIIEYYLKIAPTILYHIKGRPLTLIRFPDGIGAQNFYQKNRPDWAPGWIEFVTLGDEEQKDYILATEEATLVWLANLAALELHQMHSRQPYFDRPDYMVFDLDPTDNNTFEEVTVVAFNLKEHVESFGYHTFVKTTGGAGLHIVVPLEQRWDFSTVFDAAKEIAQPFVQRYSQTTTLQIRKEARKGRILVDIYRNRMGQSIVSPYSLRGRPGAPVSMPLRWDELTELESSQQFTIRDAVEKVTSEGDAWEGIGGWATALHTKRSTAQTAKDLPPSPHHKTPDQLDGYAKKRDFEKTSEPSAEISTDTGHRFVIHRHHASRLHYDLRLEQKGVLKSWAVPKGMPQRPGVKRLAVQTEDHPLKYLDFEGEIPKGEYGAGKMWIYATGNYTITKEKKNGMYFRLESPELSGEYRMHLMKEKEWLLEKVEKPQTDWLAGAVTPMLAGTSDRVPGGDYLYEVKWDGIRALISLDEGMLQIHTRNQNEVSRQFPELQIPAKAFRATNGLFDGEIVCLNEKGRPEFKRVINRLMSTDERAIESLSRSSPVHCYLFDCLYLDGRSLLNEPLTKRKEWLADSLRRGTPYRISESIEDGAALFEAAKEHQLEGIIAKRKDSKYRPGHRSDDWLKIKIRQTADCFVIGYTKGNGDRRPYFGALHLAEQENGSLKYRGKVGTGFTEELLRDVSRQIALLPEISKPISNKVLDEKNTTWVEPRIVVEVTYASLTPDDIFREAVFLRLRPDKSEAATENNPH